MTTRHFFGGGERGGRTMDEEGGDFSLAKGGSEVGKRKQFHPVLQELDVEKKEKNRMLERGGQRRRKIHTFCRPDNHSKKMPRYPQLHNIRRGAGSPPKKGGGSQR